MATAATTCAHPDRPPSTAEVLRLIGKDGVVVGSFAEKGTSTKDIDLVVRQQLATNDAGEPIGNAVMARVLAQYRPYCESSVMGHLWVNALPLPVELFSNTWSTDDPDKDAKRVTFAKARRGARTITVFGVELLALPRA